ncbi:helix-turn-helix domain-containing protein [Pimelobacter simplex]|uniref:helix-turn-helix domain-containing protein n=1 Tax=Nocardioides simplex TaxID=2045 RepID=UPI00214FC9C3|nr:helix-turn-helix domain-containing protein [Pimelobacter simplex]UUW88426.1 helix-turn-helix domain-containing protein [Pimelobacter simplex]UUW97930.1 helix-turn-helix domain-containing protein [Pimelobacter simplex]
MGRLFDMIEAHRDAQPYPPSYSRIAEELGVSRQTLLNWRSPTRLIAKEHLVALSEVTKVPYQRVLDALLEDIGYLQADDVPAAARKGSPRLRELRRQQDEAGQAPDPEGPEGGA